MNSARVGEVLELIRRPVQVDIATSYREIGVRSFGRGIFHKEPIPGAELGDKRVFWIEPGDLVLSNVFAWEGAIALAGEADRGFIGSHRFMTYRPTDGRIDPEWAAWFFLSEPGLDLIREASPGSAGRNKTLAIDRLENIEIPLPGIDDQTRTARRLSRVRESVRLVERVLTDRVDLAKALPASIATREDLDEASKESAGWELVPLSDLLVPSTATVPVDPSAEYRIAGIFSFGRGFIDRGSIWGAETSYKKLTCLSTGDVVVSKLNGWEGAVAVVDEDFSGAHVSSEYPTFSPNRDRLNPAFFRGIARSPTFWRSLDENTRGSMVRRRRINPAHFLATRVWLPPLDQQAEVASTIDRLGEADQLAERVRPRVDALVAAALNQEFADLV